MPLAKKRLSRSGFSLIELVIFLAIIALLATLTLTNWHFLQRTITQLELHQLQAAFNYTRQLALATHQAQTIQFDQVKPSYSYGPYQTPLSPYSHWGFVPGTYGPPSDPKTPLTQAITFEHQVAQISPQGLIAPGAVYLTDLTQKTTYALTVPLAQSALLRQYKNSGGIWVKL